MIENINTLVPSFILENIEVSKDAALKYGTKFISVDTKLAVGSINITLINIGSKMGEAPEGYEISIKDIADNATVNNIKISAVSGNTIEIKGEEINKNGGFLKLRSNGKDGVKGKWFITSII